MSLATSPRPPQRGASDAASADGARPWWRPSAGWMALIAFATFGVLTVTLWPDDARTGTNLVPLHHHAYAFRALLAGSPARDTIIRYLVTDVLGNVVLFMPVGAAIAGAPRRAGFWLRLLAGLGFGFLFSVGIELVQLTIPSRATDVDDVIFNTLGAFAGALPVALYLRPRKEPSA